MIHEKHRARTNKQTKVLLEGKEDWLNKRSEPEPFYVQNNFVITSEWQFNDAVLQSHQSLFDLSVEKC